MKKSNRTNYRVRIVTPQSYGESVTYLTRYGERVSYMSRDETPLALSNLIHRDAAALRFALEDALDGGEAADATRKVLVEQWRNNPKFCPKVEVLS